MCSPDNGISICWRPPASFSSSLIVSTIASCCRSLCPRSPDGSGSPSRTGRPIRTRRTAQYAILYCLLVGGGGALLQRRGLKPHFFGTYLNIAANVLFWALLSGVFNRQGYGLWFLALLVACGASLAWGLARRQFAFVAYAAVYGYVGVSSILIRGINGETAVLSYFVITGSRHARGAGPDRAPLREGSVRALQRIQRRSSARPQSAEGLGRRGLPHRGAVPAPGTGNRLRSPHAPTFSCGWSCSSSP